MKLHFQHLLYWANRNLSLILNKSVFSRTEVIPRFSYCFPLALLVSYLSYASYIQGDLILAYQCLKGFMKKRQKDFLNRQGVTGEGTMVLGCQRAWLDGMLGGNSSLAGW